MDSFILTINYQWHSQNGEIVGIYYETELRAPGREGWNVRLERDSGGPKILLPQEATIIATEVLPDITKIQFLDGQYFFNPSHQRDFDHQVNIAFIEKLPIGNSLILLSKDIENQWMEKTTQLHSPPPEPQTNNINDWFDYFYLVKPTRWKINMAYIAEQTHYKISTIYKEHTNYKNSHDILKRKVIVRNSKKK